MKEKEFEPTLKDGEFVLWKHDPNKIKCNSNSFMEDGEERVFLQGVRGSVLVSSCDRQDGFVPTFTKGQEVRSRLTQAIYACKCDSWMENEGEFITLKDKVGNIIQRCTEDFELVFVPTFRKGDRVKSKDTGHQYTCLGDSFEHGNEGEMVLLDDVKWTCFVRGLEKVEESIPSTILGEKPPIKDMPQPIDLGDHVPAGKLKPPMRKLLPLVWVLNAATCPCTGQNFWLAIQELSGFVGIYISLSGDRKPEINPKNGFDSVKEAIKTIENYRNTEILKHFE